ncbi:hypothetical protein H6A03_09775 [[Clostridium] spiroforme]|nr:hypothetical protein [Thomasclavelia spiroformis]MBM6880956.1 hypothetical protein [Thomasclavelia spiroformis]MBM6931242.1 hypothetical protein [Thomasclavelia spiroformis]
MNCGCSCNSCVTNPFGCSGCNGCGYNSLSFTPCNNTFGYNTGCSWFAIVLVVFLLLIICGNSRIRP